MIVAITKGIKVRLKVKSGDFVVIQPFFILGNGFPLRKEKVAHRFPELFKNEYFPAKGTYGERYADISPDVSIITRPPEAYHPKVMVNTR